MPGPLPPGSGNAADPPPKPASHHKPSAGTDSPPPANPFAVSPAARAPRLDWETISDQLPFGLLILNPHQQVLHENPACREMTGYGVVEAGGIEAWLSRLCPDSGHRERVLRSWTEHIWRNQVTRVFSLKTASQKVREVEFRSTLHEDGGITLVLQDVTDIFRAQEIQRLGKLKFRTLFERSREGVVMVDRTGRILESNPAFVSLMETRARDLRNRAFRDLIHSRDLDAWEEARADAGRNPTGATSRTLTLRTSSGDRTVDLTLCPLHESGADAPLFLYLVDADSPVQRSADDLESRLRTVARKAEALLCAVPDLVLLIDPDLSVADYAAPPEPWPERNPRESWRGQALQDVWPTLGSLISRSRETIVDQNKIVHAELESRREDPHEFLVTATNAGDGQVLVTVRIQRAAPLDSEGVASPLSKFAASSDSLPNEPQESASPLETARPRKPVAESEELSAVEPDSLPGDPVAAPLDPFAAEASEHRFRNQVQLLTSLHQFEPESERSRESSLRWQARLRTLVVARDREDESPTSVADLLRAVAAEIAPLAGRGPGPSCVEVRGPGHLLVDSESLTSFALFLGEVLRIVLPPLPSNDDTEIAGDLRNRADVRFTFLRDAAGQLQLQFETGPARPRLSRAREWETEILEILASQMGGGFNGRPSPDGEEWTLCASVLADD